LTTHTNEELGAAERQPDSQRMAKDDEFHFDKKIKDKKTDGRLLSSIFLSDDCRI
jgi:hypothetical protein